jgi:hypothetical protein
MSEPFTVAFLFGWPWDPRGRAIHRGGKATDQDPVLVGNRKTRSHPRIGTLTPKYPRSQLSPFVPTI